MSYSTTDADVIYSSDRPRLANSSLETRGVFGAAQSRVRRGEQTAGGEHVVRRRGSLRLRHPTSGSPYGDRQGVAPRGLRGRRKRFGLRNARRTRACASALDVEGIFPSRTQKARSERPGRKLESEQSTVPLPVLGSERLWAPWRDSAATDGEAPREAEDCLDRSIAPAETSEEAVGRPIHVRDQIARRRVEGGSRKAEEPKRM